MSLIGTFKNNLVLIKVKVINNNKFSVDKKGTAIFQGVVISSNDKDSPIGSESKGWILKNFTFEEIDEPIELEIKLDL